MRTHEQVNAELDRIIEAQILMDKNLQGLFQIVHANSRSIAELRETIETWYRGLSNGGDGKQK